MFFTSNNLSTLLAGLILLGFASPVLALESSVVASGKSPSPSTTITEESSASEASEELAKLYEVLHTQDRIVNNELRDEGEMILADIAMLWQASIERSTTLRYAIEKMSYRDLSGKPVKDASFTKKILKNLAQVGGAAGALWTGNPASLMGGNLVQEALYDPKNPNANSRVTDADMLLLAKEIEGLQSQMIHSYLNYRHAHKRVELDHQAVRTLTRNFNDYEARQGPNTPTIEAVTPLLASLVTSAKQDELTSQQELTATRSALALIVGADAVVALETPQAKPKVTTE